MGAARAAVVALDQDITVTGLNQRDLVVFLGNVRDTVNELVDDHATFKTTVDATELLVEELRDDDATNKTLLDELKTDLNALKTDVGTIATKLDNDATVTDTNYAAQIAGTSVAASSAAATTAPKPASGPATLSDTTDLTLLAP